MSARTSASGRQRVLRRQKREVCASADRPDHCRRTFTAPTSGGNQAKSPGQPPQKNVVCRCLLSVIGQRYTKKPGCCNLAFYGNVYFFVKSSEFTKCYKYNTSWQGLPYLFRKNFAVRYCFPEIKSSSKKVHYPKNMYGHSSKEDDGL